MTPGAVFIGDDRLATTVDDTRDSARDAHVFAGVRKRPGTVTRLLDTVERLLTQSAFASLSRESAHSGIYGQITRTTLEGSARIAATTARNNLERQIERLVRDGTPLERYELISMRQVRDISNQIGSVRANDSKLPALHRILTPYFDSLEQQIESLGPAQELIDTYVTSVNKFLDRKSLVFTASRGIRLVGRDGSHLQPESLSSGERHLILLLSQAILATAERPLVIIDEPELSLGIEWQRDLLPELLRCSQSGCVQFLIASHSVQVMSAVDRAEIVRPLELS
nr:AAA family ATPase [Microbacterium esteraromaticum]